MAGLCFRIGLHEKREARALNTVRNPGLGTVDHVAVAVAARAQTAPSDENGRYLLRQAEDGTRFYESDPFDINLTFGPIRALVAGTRLTGKVTEDDDGHDRIDGTMSFDSLSIDVGGSAQYDYPPGTTTFVALWVEDERMPEGAPRICGDQCGAVTTQCFPDPAFPGAGYCGTPAEGSGDLSASP